MAHNKQRGKYFEDKVARLIRESLQLPKEKVHRHYESGMATGEYGDIYTPLPWIIECKFYKDITLENLIFSKSKRLYEWLQSVKKDGDKYRKTYDIKPLMTVITSRPNSNVFVIIPVEYNHDNELIDLSFLPQLANPFISYKYYSQLLYVTTLDSFLQVLLEVLNSNE